MDLLKTAVIDITTLVALCHAMKASPVDGDALLPRKLRSRLRREIRHGTVAYIDTLARTRHDGVNTSMLVNCRLAAERQMTHALAHQDLLAHMIASVAGSLDGMAAARQDLWRLAHLAICLTSGTVALRGMPTPIDAKSVDALVGRLRRRFRKALIAYGRAALRTKAHKGRFIVKARLASLAEIGTRGASEAEQLAAVEAAADPSLSAIRQGVAKPVVDLALDWQRHQTAFR